MQGGTPAGPLRCEAAPCYHAGMSATGPSRARRWLGRLGIACVTLVVALAAAELFLRASGYQPLWSDMGPRYLHEGDPELGIRLRPGFEGVHVHPEFEVPVSISSQGFRDRGYGPKPEGALRILSLGDSFAFGFGVRQDEAYCEQLEARLAARGDGRLCEVINAGCASYSTAQMLTLLDRWVDVLRPDVVLFTFLYTDDLETNVTGGLVERGGYALSPFGASLVDSSALRRFAIEHSLLLTTAIVHWYEATHEGVTLSRPVLPPREPDDPLMPVHWELLQEPPDEHLAQLWARSEELIRALAERARRSGAEPVLLNIALPFQFDDAVWRRAAAHYGIDPEAIRPDAVAVRLADFCRRESIPFLDLGAGFARLGLGEADFYPYNMHFRASAHAAAARLIEEFLASKGLL